MEVTQGFYTSLYRQEQKSGELGMDMHDLAPDPGYQEPSKFTIFSDIISPHASIVLLFGRCHNLGHVSCLMSSKFGMTIGNPAPVERFSSQSQSN